MLVSHLPRKWIGRKVGLPIARGLRTVATLGATSCEIPPAQDGMSFQQSGSPSRRSAAIGDQKFLDWLSSYRPPSPLLKWPKECRTNICAISEIKNPILFSCNKIFISSFFKKKKIIFIFEQKFIFDLILFATRSWWDSEDLKKNPKKNRKKILYIFYVWFFLFSQKLLKRRQIRVWTISDENFMKRIK